MIKGSAVAVCALTLCGIAGADLGAQQFKAGTFEPALPAPDFRLEGSKGKAITLAQFRRKIAVIAFGFTHCVRICPFTLSKLAQAMDSLGANARDVQIIFVTVDPERDDIPRLREYLKKFDPTFVGVTGPQARLGELRNAYGVQTSRVTAPGGYEVHHSTSLFVVDRAGRLRLLIPQNAPVADITHDLDALLRE